MNASKIKRKDSDGLKVVCLPFEEHPYKSFQQSLCSKIEAAIITQLINCIVL